MIYPRPARSGFVGLGHRSLFEQALQGMHTSGSGPLFYIISFIPIFQKEKLRLK